LTPSNKNHQEEAIENLKEQLLEIYDSTEKPIPFSEERIELLREDHHPDAVDVSVLMHLARVLGKSVRFEIEDL
jgi:hypothetical protein